MLVNAPDDSNHQGWVSLNSVARDSIWVFQKLHIYHCPPKHISRALDGKEVAKMHKQWLNLLSYNANPRHYLLIVYTKPPTIFQSMKGWGAVQSLRASAVFFFQVIYVEISLFLYANKCCADFRDLG